MTVKSHIVVFEKRPRWAPELQRQFLSEEVTVRACRSIKDIESILVNVSQNVILLDLDSAPAACLQFLGRGFGRPEQPPVIVIGSSRMRELEWPVRELGAIDFILDSVTGEELAHLCRRQWSLERVGISCRLL